jgi:uncharacterized protein YgfB (UPF0149 family)
MIGTWSSSVLNATSMTFGSSSVSASASGEPAEKRVKDLRNMAKAEVDEEEGEDEKSHDSTVLCIVEGERRFRS